MPVAKPEKLYVRIQKLMDMLSKHHKSLHVHSKINEFYYMQKVEELRQLEESITNAYQSIANARERLESLKHNYDTEYTKLYCSWKKDVRWVNRFVNRQKLELESKP
jgi:DNA repair ATPase RecN